MKKVAFYLMTSKGYHVLKKFVEKFGSQSIEYVVSSEDKNLQKDYLHEIEELTRKEKIVFFHRSDRKINKIESDFRGFKFAISWRWLIHNQQNLIVLHDSILPRYRGFAPLVNCLIDGEREIGVTALFATEEYDRGMIIMQRKIEISYPIKILEAIDKIIPLYSDIVNSIFENIQNDLGMEGVEQKEEMASYSLWLDEQDYFINWTWDAEKIERFVNAVGYPYNGAKSYLNNKVVKIIEVECMLDVKVEQRERHIGKVIFFKNGVPIVVCGKGLLALKDVRDDKGNQMVIKFRSRFK